jgi:membrane-bound lytic murein transglycosylase D
MGQTNRMNRKNVVIVFVCMLLQGLLALPFSSLAQHPAKTKDSLSLAQQDTIVGIDTITIVEVVLDTLPRIDSLVEAESAESTPLDNDQAIEQRMNKIQNQVPLTYNKRVKGFIDYFTGRNRKYLIIMQQRQNLYFPIFEAALKKHGMPDEIKYLSIVESGLNPLAISRAGAAGLWQFMPATGREMGLMINDYIDERLDPHRSSDAACRYLSRLYKAFGDWELALASYNCGPGVVKRAIRQSGRNTFWKIYDYLPAETRGYVPQYAAVAYAMNSLEEYNMVADSILYPIETDTILIRQFVNIHVLCEQLNFCYDDFIKLNPAIRTNILPDNINYPIRLPREKKLEFLLNQHEYLQCINIATEPIEVATNDRRKSSSSSSGVAYRQKIVHTVKSGEVLGRIANKYGVSLTQLKSWNNLKSNTIRVGQKLVIYKTKYTNSNTSTTPKTTAASSGTTTTTAANKATPSTSPKYHFVQPGDTLWTISKKYGGISVDKIKQLNNLKGDTIKVGQKLIVG